MKPLEQLLQPHLRGLQPYTPGEQPDSADWIKLNTNELPFSPPPEVTEAISAAFQRLNRYPNPRSEELRHAIARKWDLDFNQVIVGNGSDDILNLLARAFSGKQAKAVQSFPSYSLYPVITAIAGGELESVPFGKDFTLPVQRLVDSDAEILFLTCPNAPTGIRFSNESLRELATAFKGILVIDEAYAEFADDNAVALLSEFENTVITRTFSKAYGLAGLRVGYAMGAPAVIEILDCIRDSYNVNLLSQAGALGALQAQDTYDRHIIEIKATRNHVRESLLSRGWDVYRSEANFLFGSPLKDADDAKRTVQATALFEWLKEQKILVRHFPKHPLTAPYLRISIGSKPEMETFLNQVKIWQKTA